MSEPIVVVVHCPVCGLEMRQTRRGATLKKRGPSYVCPLDEAETWKDERGHLHRFAPENRVHGPSVRSWSEADLRLEELRANE